MPLLGSFGAGSLRKLKKKKNQKSIINDLSLMLYYDFADNSSYPGSGTTVFDLSGNGIDGTLINSFSYNAKGGGSLFFNNVNLSGTSSYINLGDNTILNNTLNGSTNFTISYLIDPLNNGRILDRGNAGSNNPTGSLDLRTRNVIRTGTSGSRSILAKSIPGPTFVTISRSSSGVYK
jgi:hypothetical protein